MSKKLNPTEEYSGIVRSVNSENNSTRGCALFESNAKLSVYNTNRIPYNFCITANERAEKKKKINSENKNILRFEIIYF